MANLTKPARVPVSDESEAVLQKPNLRLRCQVLREIA